MLKKELRLNYKHLRKQLTSKEITDRSFQISNSLLDLAIWHYSYYHIFLSISKNKEVDTNFILSILQGRDKNVIVPKMSGDCTLEHFLLTDNTRLIPNKWGIPEPLEGIEVPVSKIEVVFIPLLAFDKIGNRIGYGKGYYDNFLKDCPKALKIGLSFFEAEDSIDDISAVDIPLDYCVTPLQIYRFNSI